MKRILIPVLLCAWLTGGVAWAQSLPLGNEVDPSGVAYFSFLRSGEVQVEVLVLGDVGRPGVYAVGLDTSPDRLLALAGGAAATARSEEVESRTTVRIYRREGESRRLRAEMPLDSFLAEPPPPLGDGDALIVDVEERVRQKSQTLDTVLRVLTAAASLILVVDRYAR